eukprot:6459701-Amphidinium_carterae.2
MSSTGQYHVTGELSPGGPSAGERLYPDAKRMKTAMEVDEVPDPERIALEQEMEEIYSRLVADERLQRETIQIG